MLAVFDGPSSTRLRHAQSLRSESTARSPVRSIQRCGSRAPGAEAPGLQPEGTLARNIARADVLAYPGADPPLELRRFAEVFDEGGPPGNLPGDACNLLIPGGVCAKGAMAACNGGHTATDGLESRRDVSTSAIVFRKAPRGCRWVCRLPALNSQAVVRPAADCDSAGRSSTGLRQCDGA